MGLSDYQGVTTNLRIDMGIPMSSWVISPDARATDPWDRQVLISQLEWSLMALVTVGRVIDQRGRIAIV